MNPTYSATVFLRQPKGSPRNAQVTLGTSFLHLEADGLAFDWSDDSLCFTLGGDDQQFLFVTSRNPDGPFDSLAVADPELIKALSQRAVGTSRALLAEFEQHRAKAVSTKWGQMVGAGLLLLALLGVALWGIQKFLVQEVVKRTPVKTEVAWGEKLSGLYLVGKTELNKGPAVDAAHQIWKRLVDAAQPNNPGYPLVLHVVKDHAVNAFALPGGHVVLLTGLMEKAQSPEEVAGVLAHEIQHVLKRHVAARIAQSMGTQILVSSVFGGGDLSALTMTAQQLGELSYGRSQESEADREGAKLMAAAHLSPAALGSFFKRLDEKGEASHFPTFLSTHPDSLTRAKTLEALAKELAVAHPRPFSIDWKRAQDALAVP